MSGTQPSVGNPARANILSVLLAIRRYFGFKKGRL
jgi:hypothetical protein